MKHFASMLLVLAAVIGIASCNACTTMDTGSSASTATTSVSTKLSQSIVTAEVAATSAVNLCTVLLNAHQITVAQNNTIVDAAKKVDAGVVLAIGALAVNDAPAAEGYMAGIATALAQVQDFTAQHKEK